MEYKSILKIFLIIIFIIGTLNFTYADAGPTIGENQAKASAQNYLNSHNLPYTAVTHSDDDWQIKVNDTKTGEVKWIPFMTWKEQFATPDGIAYPTDNERYIDIYGVPTVWIVQVSDKNEKNVGQIYVNDETGKVLKVIINGKVLKDIINQTYPLNEDPSASTNSTDTVDTVDPPILGLLDSIGIFGILSMIIGIGFIFFQVLLDNLGITLVIFGIIILIIEISIGYLIYKKDVIK